LRYRLMIIILFAIHILIAIALVGVVLLQKSEGGALGSIGGGSGMSGFMTGRSTANLLTRATAILFVIFVATSVSLVLLNDRPQAQSSIIGNAPTSAPAHLPGLPGVPAPAAAPAGPTAPKVPPAHPRASGGTSR
jgi:preprotein translocase subunit SecG